MLRNMIHENPILLIIDKFLIIIYPFPDKLTQWKRFIKFSTNSIYLLLLQHSEQKDNQNPQTYFQVWYHFY